MDLPYRIPAQALMDRLFPRTALQSLLMAAVMLGPANAGGGPSGTTDRYQACLVTGTDRLPIELEHAVTAEQRRRGLMGRTHLPANAGMLFFYQNRRAPSAAFWMYGTHIPLDIAWLDGDGVILALDTMPPCESENPRSCPSWSPGVEHSQVLEMNAGFFQKHAVAVGDRVVADLNDNKPCLPAD